MERLPDFRSVLEQFSWGRIESDGTFPDDLVKAKLKVLGSGPSFGYWSVPGGSRPHDDPGPMAKFEVRYRAKDYVHGDIMFAQEWPTDVDGWKIKESHIPHLFFSDEFPPPKMVKHGDVKDWKSWYQWRGLPFDSPASLLMDYALSVYHLLVNVLRVVRFDSTPDKRQNLVVHYIGAEVELNSLPL